MSLTIWSTVAWGLMRRGITPQSRVSRRRTRSVGANAMMGTGGRSCARSRAV